MLNPVSKAHWIFQNFFENGCPDNTVIVHTNYKDNHFLPQSYIDDLLQMEKTNPVYYKIYALGEFATLDKLIYNNWEILDFKYRDIVKDSSRDVSCYLGLDFGYVNDTNALTCVLIDNKNKELFIFDEWGEKGLTNNEIFDNIERLGYSKEVIVADSAEQKSIEELKRLGLRKIVPCKKGKDSIMYGIQLIQQFKVYVHPNCENTIEEFQNYSWQRDKKTGEYINKPIDHFNHFMDSLRYAVSYGKKNKVITINKDLLGF
jgi:phage terminase large subunit